MEIVILGTSSMLPTKNRNHTSLLLQYEDEHILVDCGEGTQRQLRIAGIAPPRITRVLLTHWHGDHVFGIPGLLENLSKHHYQGILQIYGPRGIKKKLTDLMKVFGLQEKVPLQIHEITKNGVFLKEKTFTLEAYSLDHLVPCLGYRFIEHDKRKINVAYLQKQGIKGGPLLKQLQVGKNIMYLGKMIKVKDATYLKEGKKVGIVLDTGVVANCLKIAKDADVFICEATFLEDLQEKAKAFKHLTARDAATIAKKSNAKKLLLTHFSQRYTDELAFQREAEKIFKNVRCAVDFYKETL